MRSLIQRVDRLQRLAVFEAAARCGSFTTAARELGLSQPSVTRQISALERSIGVELFHRTSNRSRLTEAGRHLLVTVDSGFTVIETSLDQLTAAHDVLVLAAPPGFAQQLIVPHLDTFHDVLPDRDLRLWIYDRDDELTAGNFDLAVRIGSGHWAGYESIALFEECAVPVAAPALADELALDASSTPEQVAAAPLLHMDADGRPWLSWTDWLGTFGLEPTPGRRRVVLNSYPTVLQQAVAGRGVALGWRGIVDSMLADGLLVEVGSEVRSDRNYCVSWPDRGVATIEVRRNLDARRIAVAWLVDLVSSEDHNRSASIAGWSSPCEGAISGR